MGNKIRWKMSTEEADRLLGEQFLREAEEAEAEILAAGENARKKKFKDSPEKKKAGYERLIAHLKETGKYREDQDKELIWMQRIKKLLQDFKIAEEKHQKEYKRVRTTGIIIAAGLVLMLAGMIAQMNPDLLKQTMIQFLCG